MRNRHWELVAKTTGKAFPDGKTPLDNAGCETLAYSLRERERSQ